MSTPTGSSLGTHPTRQQLDELDALMRRMLALPADEEAPLPARDAEPPAAVLEAPVNPPVPVDVRPRRLLSPPPALLRKDAHPTSESGTPGPFPWNEPIPETSAEDRLSERDVPVIDWPNRLYDALTFLLGPTGRWLRGPSGRAVVGCTGLLLLAGAVAWGLIDWLGWTR
jgi:hypothetical protein